MKSLLVSLVLCAFVQSANALPFVPIDLNEDESKKMYNVLAEWGTRYNDSTNKKTIEWVTAVECVKTTANVFGCKVFDQIYGVEYRKVGPIAMRLYNMLATHVGARCALDRGDCYTSAAEIRCTHWWNNKHNPPIRLYECRIVKEVPAAVMSN